MTLKKLAVAAATLAITSPAALAQCDITETAKLLPQMLHANSRLGASAVSGDTAIIAAYDSNVGDSRAGAAWVYHRDDQGDWIESQMLLPDDVSVHMWFGRSVAMDGDRAIIAANVDDAAAPNSGSAYIFRDDGTGNWIQEQKLIGSDASDWDFFGDSVAILGDLAVVGATQSFKDGPYPGKAYVFRHDGAGNWVEVAILTPSDGQEKDQFGCAVATDGQSILVGASHFNTDIDTPGAAYLFREDGDDNWVQVARLSAPDGRGEDAFGASVAIDGRTAIVGAHQRWVVTRDPGAAYLFRQDDDGSWYADGKLEPSNSSTSGMYGQHAALVDGLAVVTAPRAVTGRAYVFRDQGGGFVEIAKLIGSDSAAGDNFGLGLGFDGSSLFIGASNDNNQFGAAAGAVYAFDVDCSCPADLDGDGDADAEDFFAYLDLFASGNDGADIDGDGDIDAEDFFAYLDLFAAGC